MEQEQEQECCDECMVPYYVINFDVRKLGEESSSILVNKKPTEQQLDDIRGYLTGYMEAEFERWEPDHEFTEEQADEIHCEPINQIQEFLVSIGLLPVWEEDSFTITV